MKRLCIVSALVGTQLGASFGVGQKPPMPVPPSGVIGVTEKMLSADYWIARIPDANRVLMSVAQVEAANQRLLEEDASMVNLWKLRPRLTRSAGFAVDEADWVRAFTSASGLQRTIDFASSTAGSHGECWRVERTGEFACSLWNGSTTGDTSFIPDSSSGLRVEAVDGLRQLCRRRLISGRPCCDCIRKCGWQVVAGGLRHRGPNGRRRMILRKERFSRCALCFQNAVSRCDW